MTTTRLTTLSDIHKLEERYPFNEEELEILVRCHDHITNGSDQDQDDFLMKMALSSPYSHFFLPGDEMRDRVDWLEGHVLPPGFASNVRAAISGDVFVEYANQGEDKLLERFLEGVADTGRRGTKETLRILYETAGGKEATPFDVVDLCFRLAIASEAMMVPNLDKDLIAKQPESLRTITKGVASSLEQACDGAILNLKLLTDWAESMFPMLTTPLSTFVHNLLFHGHAYPAARIPYFSPKLDHASDVFKTTRSPFLTALSFTTAYLGGKWHRLYSTELDGRSFNRLEWSILGYRGPTLLVASTSTGSVLGAFTTEPWKESRDFYGNPECFLFQLKPSVRILRALGGDHNFMYLHSEHIHGPAQTKSSTLPHGLGFGGCLEKPRLFFPETLEHCSADFLDHTFESGNLLPIEALEKFEISSLEIWGVGGDDIITSALRERAEYRERTDTAIAKARVIYDKSFIATDMKSGLIQGNLFSHRQDVRGREEFQVDDEHGGYKIEH